MQQLLPWISPVLCAVTLILALLLLARIRRMERENAADAAREAVERLRAEMEASQRALREELGRSAQETVLRLGENLRQEQRAGAESQTRSLREVTAAASAAQESQAKLQSERIGDMNAAMMEKLGQLQSALSEQLQQSDRTLRRFTADTNEGMEKIRTAVETRLGALQQDNNKKLDEMRQIVDEKLQKTINDRMSESFRLVTERLEQVYKGLGEMQSLAQGVGDLKKVLSNVKTRGILGEVQLGNILEDILTPDQYDKNVVTKKGSRMPVEYAIKLPTEDGTAVYLPVDAKFPGETYANLRDAYDSGDAEQIQSCVNALRMRIRSEAKDIRDKYIDPPATTEFAILFLPFEGLYSEVVSRGMVEQLQRAFRVNIAGPSTLAALLNSLQMSFRTFAIQKRSGEVWNVLGAVRTEFDKFAKALEDAQKKLGNASDDLEKLVGTRTRMMQRALKNVTRLPESQAAALLAPSEEDAAGADEPQLLF